MWKCPACGAELRVSGEVTTVLCDCQSAGVWMHIASERNAVPRPQQPMCSRDIPVAEFQLTEEELAKPLEGRIRRRQAPPAPPPAQERRGPGQRTPPEASQGASPEPVAGGDAVPATPARQGRKERPPRERQRPTPRSAPPAEYTSGNSAVPEPTKPEPPPTVAEDDGFGAGLET
ncbi:hypothetical protein GC163_03905 [bacterium]|nr:hypothetical protein [bacterium]